MALANSIKAYTRPVATLTGYHGVSMAKKIAVIGGTGAEGIGLALRFAKVGSVIKIGDERAHHNEAVEVGSRYRRDSNLAQLFMAH